jgi:membrane-associated protease RseP (regulator of RpoE activity)
MYRVLWLSTVLVVGFGGLANAQSPLEELERRLEGGAATLSSPGYLGLIADDADTSGRGLQVITVRPGSPAEAAGLRANDLLVEIDRRPLRTLDDLSAALTTRAAGESVAITFERGGSRQIVTARLSNRATAEPADAIAPLESNEPPTVEALPTPPAASTALPAQEELQELRREADDLRRRLEQVEQRLKELETRLNAEVKPKT